MNRTWMMRLAGWVLVPAFIASSGASAQEQFNVRFSWKLKGEYAPFYLAQQKGLFAKEGLTVRLGEGAGSEAALGSMIQGQEDVVIIPGIYALSAVSKGMPVKIVSLIQPQAPLGIISHPEKPIATPKDLEGKTLGATVGDTTMDYLKVFCSKNNVDCGKVKIVMMNVQARLPQFMSKQVDGISTYWNIDLVQLEYSTKQNFVMLDTAKYGQVVPGLSVVASNNLIERNPDKLKRFLRALRQGFDAANSDVPAATQALRNAWQGGPAEAVVERQVTLSNTTFPVISGKPRGWVDEALVASALQLLKDAGQITEARPLSTYYTNALIAN